MFAVMVYLGYFCCENVKYYLVLLWDNYFTYTTEQKFQLSKLHIDTEELKI